MNSSPRKLTATSPRRVQPGILRRNWSTRILEHWVILILVIALSIALLPLLQVLKARRARLRESYVLLPVFTRDYGLDMCKAISRSQYSITVNTTRRLLQFPSNYVAPQNFKLPPWDPNINAWQVRRHLSEESLLFVKLNVANVTYFLDLDFRGQLSWINCKWKPKDQRSTWTTWTDKLKPHQLRGPNGLYVAADENWCNKELCEQLKKNENLVSACKMNLCHFNASYGKNENLQGVVIRNNVVLCNSSVSVNDTNYRLMKMAFGCVYSRRSKTTGKRIVHKEKLRSDGVLALNKLPLSFPGQLYDKHLAEQSIVLCLARTQGFFAGYIVFGFPVRQLGRFGPAWVPLELSRGGAYEVELANIMYGDFPTMPKVYHRDKKEKLGTPEGKRVIRIIVDGSSRFTYLDNEIFVPFVNVVKKWARKHKYELQVIEGEEGTCWSFWKASVPEAELIQGFSNVTILFGSPDIRKRLVIKPENFLISPAEGLVCLAIRSSNDIKQPAGISILGGMAMKEHMILLDKMTDQFGFIDDGSCHQDRLEELRIETIERDSNYKSNPFTY